MIATVVIVVVNLRLSSLLLTCLFYCIVCFVNGFCTVDWDREIEAKYFFLSQFTSHTDKNRFKLPCTRISFYHDNVDVRYNNSASSEENGNLEHILTSDRCRNVQKIYRIGKKITYLNIDNDDDEKKRTIFNWNLINWKKIVTDGIFHSDKNRNFVRLVICWKLWQQMHWAFVCATANFMLNVDEEKTDYAVKSKAATSFMTCVWRCYMIEISQCIAIHFWTKPYTSVSK